MLYNFSNVIKIHEHSIITAIVVGVACIFGVGLYALLLIAGFWLGREHSQAEYRYMKLKRITREELSDVDGFRLEAWNYDSFVNDLVLPIVVGVLILAVSIVTGKQIGRAHV